MVEITVSSDAVNFEVEGWDKLWSLKSRLTIPRPHIKVVYANPHQTMGWFGGIKLMGADFPHVFKAGTFYQRGNLVFWDVHDPEKTIVVDLRDERYAKLIIEVDDPEAAVRLIKEAISTGK